MDAVFTKLIEQLNSSVFVLMVVLAACFYSIYKIGKWTQKFAHQDEKINEVKGLSEKVIELRTKVDLIYQNTLKNPLVASHSPISLTPAGTEISNKIGANQILEKYISRLVAEVESTNPKNAYDIQMVSLIVAKEKILAMLNEVELNAIKDEAFARGILIEDVMSVFGVLLRNQILRRCQHL